jgi:hypothetical protein
VFLGKKKKRTGIYEAAAKSNVEAIQPPESQPKLILQTE